MLAAIGGWLVTGGVSLLLGWLTQSLLSYLRQREASQNTTDLASTKAELDQAQKTIAAQQAELEAQANAPASVTDAIKRLEDGTA